MPQVSNANFNYYIKEVARLAGINEMVKITHKHGNRIIDEIRPKHAWIMSHTSMMRVRCISLLIFFHRKKIPDNIF